MKIAVINPYWPIFGGGERYLASIAQSLSLNHEVFIPVKDAIADKLNKMFGLNLKQVHFVSERISKDTKWFPFFVKKHHFEVIFYMSDGSLFIPAAKLNYLIIQSPAHIPDNSLINRIKLARWQIICYSRFMQKEIQKKINIKAIILSPCIQTDQLQAVYPKENIILNVGRFFSHLHDKKQQVMIDVFKKNYHKHFQGWKFILAGGIADEEGRKKVIQLKNNCQGFPIEINTNIPFSRLLDFYKKSKIYWHAAGFGEDVRVHPERMEHFGITTLEAMAAGSVPLVFPGGGQKDIVTDQVNGLFWKNEEELLKLTKQLINEEKKLREMGQNAVKRAGDFSCSKFYEKVDSLFKK